MSNQLKKIEICKTVFDYDEIWYVGLWSRAYASHQMLGQSDLHQKLKPVMYFLDWFDMECLKSYAFIHICSN